MKKTRFSSVFAIVLIIALLSGLAIPLASAQNVSIEFLNPLGKIETLNNQALAERSFTDFSGKTVAIASYSKTTNSEACRALALLLEEEYGVFSETNPTGIRILTSPNLGNAWNQKTDANYATWASADAVIFGVAD